jgi:hypothetical protein
MMIMEMTTVERTPQEKTIVHTSSIEIRRETEAAGVLISVATIRKQRRKHHAQTDQTDTIRRSATPFCNCRRKSHHIIESKKSQLNVENERKGPQDPLTPF